MIPVEIAIGILVVACILFGVWGYIFGVCAERGRNSVHTAQDLAREGWCKMFTIHDERDTDSIAGDTHDKNKD